jgi:signal peptidase I
MTWTAVAAVAATLAGAAALLAWFRRRLVVINVVGQSMQPTLHEGDRVLVRRRALRHIRTGDIIVAENAGAETTEHRRTSRTGRTWIIKRAAAMPGDPVPESMAATVPPTVGTHVPDGRLLAIGDNTAGGIDSPHPGHLYLSGEGVLGVVVRRLSTRADGPVSDR